MDKRLAALSELEKLFRDGLIVKGKDGRWRAKADGFKPRPESGSASIATEPEGFVDVIHAANAFFSSEPTAAELPDQEDKGSDGPDPQALLRYWRSALRADPRGATTQVLDKHGIEWALISGRGPISPEEGQTLTVSIELDAIDPTFREALVRREGHENSLAVGWPMAVGRRGGVPVFQPVGMFAATWDRKDNRLILAIHADDVLVNPDWVKSAARASGWKRDDLADLFSRTMGWGFGLRISRRR